MHAIIFEKKYDDSAQSVIEQIKTRDYLRIISKDANDILFVGINYDKKSKKHECVMEKYAL